MYKGNHVLVNSTWRYIHYEDGTEELYNHKTDPYEWTNVAAKAEFKNVKTDMAKFLPKTEAEPRPEEPQPPAKKKKKKQASV